ncbi:TetR/AcrR family transcriptional regulator [Okibacterium endophyticum]
MAAHERILSTAYDLFSARAIRDVGVEELVKRSDVALATFYRHFPSKDHLVIAFLERREELWTHGTVEAGARSRGMTAEDQLLAIFDIFDEWFRRDDYEGCPFVNVLLEMGPGHPLTLASIEHLDHIRDVVENLAIEAGLTDTRVFARSWHILMKGSIVSAAEGDQDAAKLAASMAGDLIERHRAV